MDGIQISVEAAGSSKDVHIVKILGYIDTTTSSALERVIQGLLREQRYKIVVDLQDVDYISSAGWGIFISEIKNIRTHRGDLKLSCMSETVNEVYELLEFSTILSSANTVNDAVRLFGDGTEAATSAAKPAAKPAPAPVRPVAPPKPVAAQRPAPQPVRPTPSAAPKAPATPAGHSVASAKSSVSQLASSVNATPTQKIPAAPEHAPSSVPAAAAGGVFPLIDRVRALVKAHPDWGALKLKGELNRRRGTQPKVSWGEVRAELKYNELGSKRDRFKFARGR
jgi:anti-sigma B factor antagonist